MNNRGPMGVKSTAKGVNGRIYHSKAAYKASHTFEVKFLCLQKGGSV